MQQRTFAALLVIAVFGMTLVGAARGQDTPPAVQKAKSALDEATAAEPRLNAKAKEDADKVNTLKAQLKEAEAEAKKSSEEAKAAPKKIADAKLALAVATHDDLKERAEAAGKLADTRAKEKRDEKKDEKAWAKYLDEPKLVQAKLEGLLKETLAEIKVLDENHPLVKVKAPPPPPARTPKLVLPLVVEKEPYAGAPVYTSYDGGKTAKPLVVESYESQCITDAWGRPISCGRQVKVTREMKAPSNIVEHKPVVQGEKYFPKCWTITLFGERYVWVGTETKEKPIGFHLEKDRAFLPKDKAPDGIKAIPETPKTAVPVYREVWQGGICYLVPEANCSTTGSCSSNVVTSGSYPMSGSYGTKSGGTISYSSGCGSSSGCGTVTSYSGNYSNCAPCNSGGSRGGFFGRRGR